MSLAGDHVLCVLQPVPVQCDWSRCGQGGQGYEQVRVVVVDALHAHKTRVTLFACVQPRPSGAHVLGTGKMLSNCCDCPSVDVTLSPNGLQNINIIRDPRWGRGQETPGEDTFLTSE